MVSFGALAKGFSSARAMAGKAAKAGKVIKNNSSKLKAGFSKLKSKFKSKAKGYEKIKETKTPKLRQLITRQKAVGKSVQKFRQRKLEKRTGGKNPNAKKNFMNRVEDQGLVGKAQQARQSLSDFGDKASGVAVDAYNRRMILQQMGLVPDNLVPGEQERQNQTNDEYIRPYLRK